LDKNPGEKNAAIMHNRRKTYQNSYPQARERLWSK
jgi:hypothetical protein